MTNTWHAEKGSLLIQTMQSESLEQRELLVDTHIHSRYSDGIAGIPRIERFCQNHGLGVAVTDHNEIRGSISMIERERVPVIPGVEVGTEEGVDLLVYFAAPERLEEFYKEALEPYLRPRFMSRSWVQSLDCLQVAKEMEAYVSLAHPFAFGRKSLEYQHGRRGKSFVESVMDAVDALELYNGGIQKEANRKAKEYAATAGKRLTVGSDSHRVGTIGSCGTYLRPAAGTAPAQMFASLKTAGDLRFKMQGSASTTTIPMFGLIALKHTRHFVQAGSRAKRP
jgi:predicted metal-dependent phosphoesterase TrpH